MKDKSELMCMNNRSTKQLILLEALKLFARDGYEAVSVRDIAHKLSITQAALYRHYKNKRDIFDSIVSLMNNNDTENALNSNVPTGTFEQMSDSYKSTPLEQVKRFAMAQFLYWTKDEYAPYFRRMITVEQYRNNEMSQLYYNHLGGGVIKYLEDLFGSINKICNAKQRALEFYAPIYMMMGLYDTADDKDEIMQMVHEHIRQFEI